MAALTTDDTPIGPLPSDSQFDFTLAFEHSILSIPPSALFLLFASCKIFRARFPSLFHLTNQSNRDHGHTLPRHGALYLSKLACAILLTGLQLAVLIRWALLPSELLYHRGIALASSVLSFLSALLLILLLDTTHTKYVSPSLLTGGYLFLTILLDLAQTRSLFLRSGLSGEDGTRKGTGMGGGSGRVYLPLGVIFALSLITKGVLLLLEEIPKVRKGDPLREKAGPETVSGAVNRTLFVWLNGLFWRGYKELIALGSLESIPEKFGSGKLLGRLEEVWERKDRGNQGKGKRGKHALALASFKAFLSMMVVAVPPRLMQGAFTFTQPLLMKRVILYIEEASAGHGNGDIARGLIGATVLVYVGIALAGCIHRHLVYQLITMVRGALVGIIFKKTVRLGEAGLADAAPVTLMSTDVEGIGQGFAFMHEMWAAPIEVGVGIFLLWKEIGLPCFLVVIPIVVITILNEKLAGKMGPAKMAWNQGVQERVSATSSMLGQMKGIKMTGLGQYFSQHIRRLRDREIKLSKKFRMVTILLELMADAVGRFTPVIVITGAVFWTNAGDEHELPIAQAFTAVAIVALVAEPMGNLLATRAMFEASLGSFIRIQEFLLLSEKTNYRAFVDKRFSDDEKSDAKQRQDIELTEAATNVPVIEIRKATFETGDTKVLLRDVNFTAKQGSCHMIAGLVGSGKSSVLKAIMGELKLTQGSIEVRESAVAYCAQSPWLRNATIRENIVGGAEFGFDREWFARVVRACALDQDFAGTPDWDSNLVGSGGVVLSGGQKQRVALARAVYSRKRLVLLDDVFSGLDHKTSAFVFDQLIAPGGLFSQARQTVILTTNQPHILSHADSVSTVEESTLKTVAKEVVLCALNQEIIPDNSPPEDQDNLNSKDASTPTGFAPSPKGDDDALSDLKRQSGDTSLYTYYFTSVGWKLTLIFVALNIICAAIWRMPQVWLKIWTDHGTNNDTGLYFGIYVGFALLGAVSGFGLFGFFYFIFIPKSGKQLHSVLLDAVLKAPLYFFTSVDSGVTLNRFSQDLTLIDQRLPISVLVTCFFFLDVIAASIIIVAGAQYAASIIPFILAALYFLQKFYLRTSRQMRFLDIEAKSPLYTHFTETLAGAVTVRAFGWEQAFLEENQRRLDLSQKPFYLMYCLQRWLTVVLDLLVAGMAVVLVSFAVLFTWTSSSSAIGLAFLNIVGFSQALMGLVHMWTQLEMSLGAIARIRDFVSSTPKESLSSETFPPPSGWPTSGSITLRNIVASYSPSLPPALNGVDLTIPAGSKVAICGRTGSGKSSTLLTLLRLLDISSGTITIDNVDISLIPREEIRTRIASLPQDPVTIPGTVRTNLAPLCDEGSVSDADLISALTKARIWDVISSRGGLDAQMDSVALSPGQRQLFCLAAAAVRKAKVVLLDEVTGSVDLETDKEVRRVLMQEGLRECTVVEVVHRIEMVMGYDVLVVMDGGRVVEVGAPEVLVGKEGGMFRGLWEGRGEREEEE